MPHIYIPEVFITQDEYDMIQDNQVPIDCFIANKVRNEEMFVYIQETDATYKAIKKAFQHNGNATIFGEMM